MASIPKAAGAPRNGGQSIKGTDLTPVNPSQLVRLRKQVNGARRRVERLKKDVADIAKAIRSKSIPMYSSSQDEPVRYRKMSGADLLVCQGEEIGLKKDLAEAKWDLKNFSRMLRGAAKRNNQVQRAELANTNKRGRLEYSVPLFVGKCWAIIEEQKEVTPDEYRRLLESAKAKDQDNFRTAFESMVNSVDSDLMETISALASVKTRVVRAVMKQMKTNGVPAADSSATSEQVK